MTRRADFPSDSEQQKIGRAGESKAAAFFASPGLGLAWRPGETSTDWGVDGELELVDVAATGLLVKAQIKGTKDTERLRRTGSQTVTVEPQTWNYWAALHLPVVAVLVDITTDELFWTIPERAFATERKSVTFERAREATVDPARFVAAVARAARSPASAELLDQIGHHLWTYKRLRRGHQWSDVWFPLKRTP